MTAYRLTLRDGEIAAWLERLPWATADQVARRFGVHPTRAYVRLRALRAAGAVEHQRVWHQGPGAFYVGRAPSVRTWQHDHALAEVLIDAELAGHPTVTEREMRRDEARSGERRWSVPLAAGATRELWHRPDLVLDHDYAVEVELTAKGRTRLAAILAAYARSPRYLQVTYLVPEAHSAQRIAALAVQQGGHGLIVTHVLSSPEERAA